MGLRRRRAAIAATLSLAVLLPAIGLGIAAVGSGPEPLALLSPPAKEPNPKQAALGRQLFFENRLSGDTSLSCASCHQPAKAFTDGLNLSRGYPGSPYFRNTPTVINSAKNRFLYWDGRLSGSDLPTLVRDHIVDAHFMNADGRLVVERLKQVPDYERRFKEAFGGEPTFGRVLDAVAAYLTTLRSRNASLDRYLAGDKGALSDDAKAGLALFQGKASCTACHGGPLLSDGEFRNLGVPENPDIFLEPERHITFRWFMKTLGVPGFVGLREDVGRYVVDKEEADRGAFRTPSLREVNRTAPYMHNGVLATLEEVVEFYDRGGGDDPAKDPLLRPLGFTSAEKRQLVEFLKSLSGEDVPEESPKPLPYGLLPLGAKP